jgi:hypothetical protein
MPEVQIMNRHARPVDVTLWVEVSSANDSMQDDGVGPNYGAELARILRQAADHAARAGAGTTDVPLRDRDGNTVGRLLVIVDC